MPIQNNTKEITITSGGGTIPLDTLSSTTIYNIIGNVTLTSNLTIEPVGTLFDGLEYKFVYKANIELNSNTINIFGKFLPETLSNKTHQIRCNYYNGIWEVDFIPDLDEDGFLNPTMLSNYNFSDKEEVITVPISFEVGEQGKQIVYFPYAGGFDIHGVWVSVSKTMSGTDPGIITFYERNLPTVMTTTLGNYIPIPDSIIAGDFTGYDQADFTSYVSHPLGSTFITVETFKATPGGKALLYFLIRKH